MCKKKIQEARFILSFLAFLTGAAAFLFSAPVSHAVDSLDWEMMEKRYMGDGWQPAEHSALRETSKGLEYRRENVGRGCLTAELEVDLGRTPWLIAETGEGNAHWRLTAQVVGPAGLEGPERVAADHQTEGVCVRNIAELLQTDEPAVVRLRFKMWGWRGPGQYAEEAEIQKLLLERVSFAARGKASDASKLSGTMKERYERHLRRAADIRPVRKEHPSLRYRPEEREALRKKAVTTHEFFVRPVLERIDNLAELKKEEPLFLTRELVEEGREAWRSEYIRLRPSRAPDSAEGWSPFEADRREDIAWRMKLFFINSRILIASAIDDDPFWLEQARRWVLAMARWRFWMRPAYIFFDFETTWPLQNMAAYYDVAYPVLTEEEREEVRSAIAYMARGLYLNTLTGHGSIRNNLRGNHTAATMLGLGMAGLVLLEEHPEASVWVAQAEELMLAVFEHHESGATFESPSYGAVGVRDWLKFSEMLANVTGIDHLQNPYFKRFADYQVMISDWEGLDLGHNQGGEREYWNHWIFLCIAREFQCPETQWLAEQAFKGADYYTGFGDAFWWADPGLESSRPEPGRTGRSFGDVGLNVWRDSWDDDATILLHQCGGRGPHSQENMNNFVLYAYGERILGDGLGGRSAEFVNVPLIGDRGQNRHVPGETLRFHSDENAGYSLGDARRAYRTGVGLRHVLYLRKGAVVLIDEIDTGRREDDITLQLHPYGDTRYAGEGVAVDSGRARMLAAFCDFDGVINRPEVVDFHGRRDRATHSVKAVFPGEGARRMITFLRFGAREGVPAGITGVRKRDGYIEFTAGGESWKVGFGAGKPAPGFRARAPLWAALVEDGEVRTAMAVGAERDRVELGVAGDERGGAGFTSWEGK